MENIVDALVYSINEFITTDAVDGGISGVITVNGPTRWGDPGIVEIDEYPFFYVEPQRHEQNLETMSLRGYDVRTNYVQCCFVVNSADFFNAASADVSATRECVIVGEALWKWLRKFSKLKLDDPTYVRNVNVQSVDYVPMVRGDGIFTRLVVVQLAVEKQYPHES